MRTSRVLLATALLVVAASCADDDSTSSVTPATTTASTATTATVPSPTTVATTTTTAPATLRLADGLLLYGTTTGDIARVDPATGAVSTIIGGATSDAYPYLSFDGQHILFERASDNGQRFLWVAASDGSDARQLSGKDMRGIGWVEWSLDGTKVGLAPMHGGNLTVVDVATGESTTLDIADDIVKFGWVDDRLLVSTNKPDGTTGFALVDLDGDGLTPLLVAADATHEFSLSADGTKFAYMSWGQTEESHGRIHVFDIGTLTDHMITPRGDGLLWEEPTFSPDGEWLKLDRFEDSATPLQPVLLAADGSGDIVLLGPAQVEYDGATSVVFSPDGSQLILRYNELRTNMLFDTATGTGAEITWPDASDAFTWQATST